MSDVKLDLILPDQHIPHNNPIVWKTYLAVARGVTFANIITAGDFLDCAAVSAHPRPTRLTSLSDEIAAGNQALDELTEAGRAGNPDVRFTWLDGNHEFRLAAYLANAAPALQGLTGTTIQDAMKLAERGWKYVPYRSYLKLGNAYLAHDVKKKAGATAHRWAVQTLHVNIIHVHTHRMAIQYEGSIEGVPHYGAMLGWGGDISAVTSYNDELSAMAESVHGFGILKRWTCPRTGQPRSMIEAVPVISGACVVGDKLFVG